MGKIIIESNYRRLASVGQDSMCASCSCYCKTSCARIGKEKKPAKKQDQDDIDPYTIRRNSHL